MPTFRGLTAQRSTANKTREIMKYFVLVPDGAGDEKIEELGDKTPLDVANMPTVTELAQKGKVGSVKTVPDGIAPGSDAANLSVMGYDPKVYLTGRSPLEAASIGIDMKDTDVSFRVNIITVSDRGEPETAYEDLEIVDHSSGDITTEEADVLIRDVAKKLSENPKYSSVKFYTGVSYRHCMIMENGSVSGKFTPPHDVLGQITGEHLPKGDNSDLILSIMKESYEILKNHPVNLARIEKGLRPGNTMWIWGQGKKPALSNFTEKYHITGSAISAVDLIKGIALCAGLDSIDVEGATGNLHTNYTGKANAAMEEFKKGKDFVYMHVEAPDECGHQGDVEGKVKCLEDIDEKVLKPVVEYLKSTGEPFKVLVVPDHKTPIYLRTHTSVPVPYVIYRSDDERSVDESREFTEDSGQTGEYFANGYQLADYFFGK